MAFDPYDPCPCGSGKKFKWCCEAVHAGIETAFEQFNAGQQDVALRSMEAVVAQHGTNPEAHGRHAQLLTLLGKMEEAEAALEKAFTINPRYPFGLLLQGQMRLAEGELIGGLMLFRRAAEAYAPEAADALSYVHQLIADCEMRRNNPVAARAALKRAIHLAPAQAELREAFDGLFGDGGRVPAGAGKEYVFRSLPHGPASDQALSQAGSGKLGDALKAFEAVASSSPDDANARYNVGLVQAWLGEPKLAVDSLARSVDLEADAALAEEAWTLAEFQKCVLGMESETDYVEHRCTFPVRDPNALIGLFQVWEQSGRMVGLRANPEQGMLSALVLDNQQTIAVAGSSAPPKTMAAYMMVVGNALQFWHPRREAAEAVATEAAQRLGDAAHAPIWDVGPIQFGDVAADALIFPSAQTTDLDAQRQVKEAARKYFEQAWIHRAFKSLNGQTPVEAAKDPALRKRLGGVITFTRDCAGPAGNLYDFTGLRQQLGLTASATPTADIALAASGEQTPDQLADAFRAALQAGQTEEATRLAHTALALPTGGDRYPYAHHLATEARKAGDFTAALGFIDEGLRLDCEGNDGHRRNDYELRRGDIQAAAGDADAAFDTFERLLQRLPGEPKLAGAAAEAMLRVKQPARARQFVERGLTAARQSNNRDLEEYLNDLGRSAERQGG